MGDDQQFSIRSIFEKAAAVILAASITGGAVALASLRDSVVAGSVTHDGLRADVERLRTELDAFRNPGGRVTAHDGDRHWSAIMDIDKRLREQEMRPPRLNPALEKAKEDLSEVISRVRDIERRAEYIAKEQDRLCERLRSCK